MMKARVLRKMLGNTGYIIHETQEHICVGSPYVSNLISVHKDSLEMKYALDTFREGKRSLRKKELVAIWEQLEHLISTGEIQEIIQGEDVINAPLPVFTYDQDYRIVESVTDSYGWPNTDIRGELMYDNTWFATKNEAIQKAIKECEAVIAWQSELLETKRAEIATLEKEIVSARLQKSLLVKMSKGME